MRNYFKVKYDKCPICGGEREIVEQGICYRKNRIEKPRRIIGWQCYDCGDCQKVDIIKITNQQKNEDRTI